MSYTNNPAIEERGLAKTPPLQTPTVLRRRTPIPQPSDSVLEHYLKRVDPAVADSFSPAQREAIKTMLGARGVANHAVEIRRSLPFGRRRIYCVFLMGAERRSLARLYGEGMVSRPFNTLVYLGLGAIALAPLVAIVKAIGL